MVDASYQQKVYLKQGGDELVVASGGSINVQPGGVLKIDGTQGAALTAQLTTITPADAQGTPDYAIAAVVNTSAYGFSNAAEAITVLYVIRNLQIRLAEMEARLEGLGLIVAN